MLWMLYGLPAVQPHGMPIIIISATGIATQLAYIALFLAFSAGNVRRRLILLLIAIIAFVGVLTTLVLCLAHTHESRAMIIGIIIVLFGTGMYASPLTVMVSKFYLRPDAWEFVDLVQPWGGDREAGARPPY
jgi:solute carrier family 50 protein (sugar transporter)